MTTLILTSIKIFTLNFDYTTNMISDNLKADIEKFNDFKQETIEATYDDVAQKYDSIMLGMGHPDPVHCA